MDNHGPIAGPMPIAERKGDLMGFANDRQISLCCRALLKRVRLERLWTETGPTAEASELLKTRGGPLSSGEALMVLIAFDLWNGHGNVSLGRMLDVLDGDHMVAVCTLLIAVTRGEGAIDAWLAEQR